MSPPLRCAALLPASPGRIRAELARPGLWVRWLRALGYRSVDDVPATLAGGSGWTATSDRRIAPPMTRTAEIRFGDPVDGLPMPAVRLGPRAPVGLRVRTAATGAGSLTTLEFRRPGRRRLPRRGVLAAGELLLGLLRLACNDPQVVVCAVVISDGRVLGARRVRPPELAGLWEMPGGKVEDGEDEVTALARELVEELGVRVAVGPRFGESIPVAADLLLRPYLAELVDGDPRPMEAVPAHDAVRWFTAAELDPAQWLPGDAGLVRAVADHLGSTAAR